MSNTSCTQGEPLLPVFLFFPLRMIGFLIALVLVCVALFGWWVALLSVAISLWSDQSLSWWWPIGSFLAWLLAIIVVAGGDKVAQHYYFGREP